METGLKRMREELGLTQDDFFRFTTVAFGSYRNAENGKKVTNHVATDMVKAMNAARAARNLSPISLADLELNLY